MREGVGSQNPLLQILCLRPDPQPVKQSSQWRKGPEDTGADSVCSLRGKPITAASSFTGCPALCHTLLKNILLLLGVVALLLGGGCVVVGWRVCCRVAGVLLSDGWCVVVGWQVWCCWVAGMHCACKSQKTTLLFLSFNHVVPRDGTPAVRLGHRYPHLLNCLAGPGFSFLKQPC